MFFYLDLTWNYLKNWIIYYRRGTKKLQTFIKNNKKERKNCRPPYNDPMLSWMQFLLYLNGSEVWLGKPPIFYCQRYVRWYQVFSCLRHSLECNCTFSWPPVKNKPKNFVTRPPDEQEFAFVKIGVFLRIFSPAWKTKKCYIPSCTRSPCWEKLIRNSKWSIWSFACPKRLGILIYSCKTDPFINVLPSLWLQSKPLLLHSYKRLFSIWEQFQPLCNCDTVTVSSIVSTIKSLLWETSSGFKTFACERLSGVEKYVYLHFAKYSFT